MDPQVCWERFYRCTQNSRMTGDAIHALQDLESWCAKGGFPPRGVSRGQVLCMARRTRRTIRENPDAFEKTA